MKNIEYKQAVVLVDYHNKIKHKTEGRYLVGARNEEEAVKLVKDIIGFGSVQFYLWDENPRYICKYKEVVMEKIDRENCKEHLNFKYIKPHHANSPKNTWNERIK